MAYLSHEVILPNEGDASNTATSAMTGFLFDAKKLRRIKQGSRGSFGFVWFQKSKKEPQSGSCGVGSSAVRFLAVQETVRFYECDSCAT